MINDKHIIDDIFKKYEQERINGKEVNYTSFEHELRDRLGIGYQEVKIIINDIFNSGRYQKICYGYAKENRTIEFNQLIKRFELKSK